MTESIGSLLKQRREARHLSIEQVAGQTRIRTYYLLALENDDLSAIPSMPQARGFLRIYSEFLGLNQSETSSPPSEESQEPISQAPSAAEALLPPAPSNPPAPDLQPDSTFFGGLRERFARRSSAETVVLQPEPVLSSESEPEPFVPIRVHEELPAAPEEISVPEPEPIAELEPGAKPARPRKQSSRKAPAKKPARAKAGIAKTAKSREADAGKKAQVKKKITKLSSTKKNSPKKKISLKKRPRPTRLSLPRKPGSFHPRRRPAKPLPRRKIRSRKRLSLKKQNK
jgi:transcriptional regulator with XRE-family HTH domain